MYITGKRVTLDYSMWVSLLSSRKATISWTTNNYKNKNKIESEMKEQYQGMILKFSCINDHLPLFCFYLNNYVSKVNLLQRQSTILNRKDRTVELYTRRALMGAIVFFSV